MYYENDAAEFIVSVLWTDSNALALILNKMILFWMNFNHSNSNNPILIQINQSINQPVLFVDQNYKYSMGNTTPKKRERIQ